MTAQAAPAAHRPVRADNAARWLAGRRPHPGRRWRCRGVRRSGDGHDSRSASTALVAALVAAAALAGAGIASAHAARVATDPADKAVLAQGPQRVSATFNEELQPEFAAMTVVGPDGNLWSTGDPQVQGAVISVGVRTLGPAGTYTVNYRVTSADGHPVSGSWSFRLTVAATGTPGPPAAKAADASRGGLPVWPFLRGGSADHRRRNLVDDATQGVTSAKGCGGRHRRRARRLDGGVGGGLSAGRACRDRGARTGRLCGRRHARPGGGADAGHRSVPRRTDAAGRHARCWWRRASGCSPSCAGWS